MNESEIEKSVLSKEEFRDMIDLMNDTFEAYKLNTEEKVKELEKKERALKDDLLRDNKIKTENLQKEILRIQNTESEEITKISNYYINERNRIKDEAETQMKKIDNLRRKLRKC